MSTLSQFTNNLGQLTRREIIHRFWTASPERQVVQRGPPLPYWDRTVPHGLDVRTTRSKNFGQNLRSADFASKQLDTVRFAETRQLVYTSGRPLSRASADQISPRSSKGLSWARTPTPHAVGSAQLAQCRPFPLPPVRLPSRQRRARPIMSDAWAPWQSRWASGRWCGCRRWPRRTPRGLEDPRRRPRNRAETRRGRHPGYLDVARFRHVRETSRPLRQRQQILPAPDLCDHGREPH